MGREQEKEAEEKNFIHALPPPGTDIPCLSEPIGTRYSHGFFAHTFWYLEKRELLMKDGVEAEEEVSMCVVTRS